MDVVVLDVAVLAVVHLTHLVDSLIAPDMGNDVQRPALRHGKSHVSPPLR